MKVLVIEKEKLMIDAYCQYLEHRAFTVFCAQSEKTAISLLVEHQDIAAVIIDTTLSEMELFELVNMIHATHNMYKRHPDIYIITAEEDAAIKEKLNEHNIAGNHIKSILNKPVDLNLLYRLLTG